MLVLTRKIGESVVIGDAIYCTVLGYRAGEVRLAVDAPRIIPVHRDEVQGRIWREQQKNKGLDNFNPDQEDLLMRLISQLKQEPLEIPLTA